MPEISNTNEILILVSVFLELVIIAWFIRTEIRLNKFLKGKDAKNLEDTINIMSDEIKSSKKFNGEARTYLNDLNQRMSTAVRFVETVRFNPFKGTGSGGNQSFATSFLNEKGDGAVISSIYSRDRVSVFSKPLRKFASDFELSEEELDVINKTKNKISPK